QLCGRSKGQEHGTYPSAPDTLASFSLLSAGGGYVNYSLLCEYYWARPPEAGCIFKRIVWCSSHGGWL
uniref:Uncharacterized protein n=1 Tax=Oryza meridionalis TaxID=40149 RepID=A0A0E0CI03_9ORYZ